MLIYKICIRYPKHFHSYRFFFLKIQKQLDARHYQKKSFPKVNQTYRNQQKSAIIVSVVVKIKKKYSPVITL